MVLDVQDSTLKVMQMSKEHENKKNETGTGPIRTGKVIKGYVFIPVISALLLLDITVCLYFTDIKMALISSLVFIVYVIFIVIYFLTVNKRVKKNLFEYINDYETLERKFIDDFPVPYAVADSDGYILLYNRYFGRIYDKGMGEGNLKTLFPSLDDDDISFEGEKREVSVIYNKRNYRLSLRKYAVPQEIMGRQLVAGRREADSVLEVFLFDETEVVSMARETVSEQTVVVNIFIDNYTETLDSGREFEGSLIRALVEKTINEYFEKLGGIVRRNERNRYFVIFKRKYLASLQSSRFDILDEVKKIKTGKDVPVTISMGVGVDRDLQKSSYYSKLALDLALGRGGDQAVVREGERIYFYGGKTKRVEKNTRVKARIIALSLKEAFLGKERIVVMGHRTGDADSFGASVGIYKAARALGKNAYIVINSLTNTVDPILKNFLEDDEYRQSVFLNGQEAERIVDSNTALVVVDVNRPSIFEQPDLVRRTNTVIMIDHHIQSGERVDNLVLSYIEPTASSASEMVTEILQYITEDEIPLKKIEAEALYAGILIDTNYFSKNTGVRTFEAAAYLRKNGVDVARVKGLFNDTLEDFKAKAETIKNAEIIEKGFAMAVSPSKGVENPTIVAAQVANELLDICGIVGSFVLTEYNNKIYVSARSVGNVNVQLVMERMGGGGHLNMAGAQLPGGTIEDTKKKLKFTLRKMLEEGVLDEGNTAAGR